ncbi:MULTISPECIES: hypothetical protein [unclassified Blastococcus]
MLTVPLAWTAVLGAVVGAALFGQTARTAARPRRRRSPVRTRIGLAVSMSGPWLALLAGAAAGAATGAWLPAAAATVAAVVVVALTGLALAPR